MIRKLVNDYVALDKSFKATLYKPIQDFIDRDMWFMEDTIRSYLYMFHPVEIINGKVIKCFVMQGRDEYTHEFKNLTIKDFLQSGEIIDVKVLKELNAELAKFMLQTEP